MTMFADLLYIKRFRERQAELDLVRQRSRRATADRAQQNAESELAIFHRQAVVQETSMYSDLCTRVVKLRDIEHVQQQIAILKASELRYQEALDGAEQALNRETRLLDERGEAHRRAVRMTTKFAELEEAHLDSVHRAFDYKEEQEMEDISVVLYRRPEWDFAGMDLV